MLAEHNYYNFVSTQMKPKESRRYFIDKEGDDGTEESKHTDQSTSQKDESHKHHKSDSKTGVNKKQKRTDGKKDHFKKRKDKQRQDEPIIVDKNGKPIPFWKIEEEIELYDDEEFRSIENRSDPFEGEAPVPTEKIERYERGKKNKVVSANM